MDFVTPVVVVVVITIIIIISFTSVWKIIMLKVKELQFN